MSPETGKFQNFRTVFWLAVRDYRHEWRMSSCFVLALAAVLAPMLVLFGLKFGVVTSMVERLVEDPRTREIRPVGSGRYEAEWFGTLRARPYVGFLMPRTRSLAATVRLYNPKAPRIVPVEMIPSGPNDPLLGNHTPAPEGLHEVVLSQSAAEKLRVSPGDTLDGSLSRNFRGRQERVHVELAVKAVTGPAGFSRDGAFVSLDLLVAAEDFLDGRAVPALDWTGDPPVSGARSFPGYRLYARSIYDVARLRDELAAQGLEARTSAADIDIVQAMDRNFSTVFWIIALVGLVGYSLSLGASLWANVDRKRRELSVLRLLGVETGDLVWFPVLQALFTGLLGWLLAGVVYLAVEQSINRLVAAHLAAAQALCRLLPSHFAAAMGFTLCAAVLAAVLSGSRAARIEPSEGLREV
jgi:putative ABC transport system permease protein